MTNDFKKILLTLADIIHETISIEDETPDVEVLKPKKQNKKAAKPVNDFDSEDEPEEETEEDSTEEETESDDFDSEEVEEELSAKQLAEIKTALNSYSVKHGREKAIKALKQHAETVTKLKPSQIKPLLKTLKV